MNEKIRDVEPDHRSVGVLGKIEHKAKNLARETEEELREVRERGPRF
jgi:hypothetical protein